ncbi:hypothetical protein BG011_000513, partial [Mortierella polycephala]
MPSQQPPHLLSTPKLGLERERDMMGSSGVQDWNLSSPSSNNLSNITCTSSGAAASPSGASSSIMCPAPTALNASTSRNRPGSVNGGAASSSIGTAHTHLPSSLNNMCTAAESGHSSEPPSSRATSASRSIMPSTNESGESRIASNTISNMEKRLGMEGSTAVSTFTSTSTSMSDDTSLSPSDYKSISARNSSDRSNNLTPLPRRHHRTQSSQSRTKLQSPSVQLALADPTLSKSLSASPSPSRPTLEQDQQAHAKRNFERNVQRYYYQLTVGCQLSSCTNKLCRSSKSSPRMTKDAAAILSIQLATRPRLFFCRNCPLDPGIHVPDSPLPASTPCNNPPIRQRMQDLPPKLKTPKLTTTVSSQRPSLGPGGSVEDLTHSRDHALYQPSEYSKSVPSFKVSNILSPVTTSHSSAVFHRKSESKTATHSATETSTPTERSGTPLFRTLLSVSPFSSMFSTRSHSTKKQNECKRHGLSPSQRNKKSSVAGSTDGSARVSSRDAGLYSVEARILAGTLQAPHRRRSFSPTRSASPPLSPIPTAATPTDNSDAFHIHPLLRKDGSPFSRRDQHSPGKHFVDYAEEAIGLGYTSRLLQSQKVLDLSRYYHAPTMSEAKISKSRGRRKQRRRSRGNNDDQGSESSFESSRDPDSDSLDSCSSADDEQTKMPDQQWRELLSDTHLETQLGQEPHLIPTTSAIQPTFSSPLSPFEQDFGQKRLCSGNRNGLRMDSTTAVNSRDEAATRQQPWLTEEAAASSFSSSSSRRSSVSDGGDLEVALPYLNLALLRQAIATYSTTKPEREMLRSLPLLDFKDFRPISTDSGVRSFESGDNQEDVVLTGHEAEVGRRRLGMEYESDPNDGFRTPPSFDNKESIADPLVTEQAEDMPQSHQYKFSDADSNELMSGFGMACPQDNVSSESEADDFFVPSRFGSPAHSMASSSTHSAGGDSTFLVDSLRSVFSSALALGSSFLMKDREERSESDEDKDTTASLNAVNVGGIDLEALRECYEMMIELKPRTIFAIQVTNSIEILLAKLELEQDLAMGQKQWTEEEMRAILILLMNPFLFEQPYQESLLRRILLIFVSFQDTTTLIEWLSCTDEEGMAQLVTLFKMYLSAHFTPRPAGPKHPAICAVKALSILYEANDIGMKREQEKQRRSAIQDAKDGKTTSGLSEATSTISYKYFYSGVMEALKFKDEYQIWREGWGK